jgi:hypothetical protein
MQDYESERKIVEILRVLSESEKPLGARVIAKELRDSGIFLGERAVRYILRILDERGLTVNHGYHGRTITEKGLQELEDAAVYDRVGFILSKIENMAYSLTYDPGEGRGKGKGEIIVNLSYVPKEASDRILEIVEEVFLAGYTVSPHVGILEEGEEFEGIPIPEGRMGIATTCSITIDGVLLKAGIPTVPRYGGIVQVRKGKAVRFTDLIAYQGSSLDPLEVFMARGMTSVGEAVRSGSGKVLANFREIPASARERAKLLLQRLEEEGFRGVLALGEIHHSLLSVPVGMGRIGLAIVGGLNALAAVEEEGIQTETKAITGLMDIRRMKKLV